MLRSVHAKPGQKKGLHIPAEQTVGPNTLNSESVVKTRVQQTLQTCNTLYGGGYPELEVVRLRRHADHIKNLSLQSRLLPP